MNKLWEPSAARIAQANLTTFSIAIGSKYHVDVQNYDDLWRWSIQHKREFWREVWAYGEILGVPGDRVLLDADRMPGARWFPDATLNFAQNLLERRSGDDTSDALVFWGEDKIRRRVSHAELHSTATRVAAAIALHGIVPGDRVAAFMPNLPETVDAMLGATSQGAIWSSCSPDFGERGVLDRFGQIAPRVLFTVDGYWYNGHAISILDKVAAIVARLPSLERVVVVPYLHQQGLGSPELSKIRGALPWDAWLAPHVPGPIAYAMMPFAHPLYILYTSGTTGVPKCVVHGAGGTLLQHLKEHLLHGDVKRGDRLFYFTTCGWMMWNWMVSALAAEATLLLYDGSSYVDRGRILWDFAESERVTHFGASAKYIDAQKKIAQVPRKDHDLSPLRTVFTTRSPLVPDSFDYVYQCVKEDLCLSSIFGGTDIVSCFALGAPTLPVWRGEITCRGLGMDVDVFDAQGNSVLGEKGELVCKSPFPSMPVGFWNDADGMRYQSTYFHRFSGIWCHGDWVELTEHGGMIVHGRSDATLNPGGVRIGTAEIYRQVEQLPEVVESLAIGQAWPPGDAADVRVVLFVKLQDGLALDQRLIETIKETIRRHTTPRHVPAKIVQVTDIPHTKTGKVVELAVRDVVHGHEVSNLEALANPASLEQYRDRAELREERHAES